MSLHLRWLFSAVIILAGLGSDVGVVSAQDAAAKKPNILVICE